MNYTDFKQIDPSDIKSIRTCTIGFDNSESSVATMFMWQHYSDVKYCIEDSVLYSIYRDKNNKYASFMPYGKKRNSQQTVDTLINLYKQLNEPLVIKLCTEDFVCFLKNSINCHIKITETPNSFDYIYRVEDLINLSGKKYHSKKNHINSFNNKYSYKYVRYDPSLKEVCLSFCKKTLKEYYNDDETSYTTELYSIAKTFDNMESLNLKCGIIFLDGNIIALSVGEKLNDNYALIHIEKADYKYRTAYSVINNLFLKNEFADSIYVNREEDMGIEGLRKAKMSYHPCHMIKKYTVEFI